jgi:hypothetical protein
MRSFKGIIKKLEFKALLYITGLSKNQLVDIINMEDYFSIHYLNSQKISSTTYVNKIAINKVISDHYKTLLIINL